MGRIRPVTETHPAYDFLIYKDGDYYKIQDGNSLSKVYKDKDPAISVQKAIDLAPAGGGIFIKNGEYPLSDYIRINKSLTLDCQRGVKFTNPNNLQLLFHVTADKVTIRNLTADGNNHIETYHAIILVEGNDVLIEGCRLVNCGGGSAVRFYGCNYGRVTNCYLNKSFHGIIYLYASNYCLIANNVVNNEGSNGAFITAYASGTGHVIDGNSIYGGEVGVYLELGLRNCVISNNVFESLHDTGVFPYFAQAIKIEGSGGNVISGNVVRDVYGDGFKAGSPNNVFSNNVAELIKKRGFEICHNRQLVVHNIFKDCGYESNDTYPVIYIHENASYCKIRNNIISSEQSNLPSYGIQEESGSDYNEIYFNRIENVVNKGVIWSGSNTKVAFNIGFVTENSGEVTIPAGSSYVDVTHGLDITPSLKKIVLTPLDDLGGRSIWVSDANSSTFRINLSSVDSIDHTIGWSYRE